MKDIGLYEVFVYIILICYKFDSILNLDKVEIECLFVKVEKGKRKYIDLIVYNYLGVYNLFMVELFDGDVNKQMEFDFDFDFVKKYFGKLGFDLMLRKVIDYEYYDFKIIGMFVVVFEGI